MLYQFNNGNYRREVYTHKPPLKVEYKLTELGETLIPLI
ncbi:winged helix-turn-helix transcriptional regulator [Tenacibaculum caenipelagi]|nr:winged helix-turn-helix transcriptional regulator [Tenacibaculum caenipelagi]